MKSIDEIIGRAENLLCIRNRCCLEYSTCAGKRYTRKQRNEQRLLMYEWLTKNDYIRYMTKTEKYLFEKPVGNPFLRETFRKKEFAGEAIGPLLWILGLTKKLTSYSIDVFSSRQVDDEIHYKLKTNVPDTHQQLLKKVVMKSEEEIELHDQIAMLWFWRVIEGRRKITQGSVQDILLEIWGEAYADAIKSIFRGKKDFYVAGKPVYKLSVEEFAHLYQRAKWRYHAFEWVLTEEDWDDVPLNT